MNHEQLKRLEFILKRLTSKVDKLEETLERRRQCSESNHINNQLLEERIKHLEEHYNFELRKDMEEDINQLSLPLEEDKDINRITSPLQDW